MKSSKVGEIPTKGVGDMQNCSLAEIEARIRHLVEIQYQGHTLEDLRAAADERKPVSFAVYPEEDSKAAEAQYELYLPNVVADSVDGFVRQISRAIHDRYVVEEDASLSPDDIYCVDITS